MALITPNQLAFKARLSGDQTISNSTATKVTLDTENFDVGGVFASNKFTAPFAGKFIFHYATYTASLGDDKRITMMLYKNGSEVADPKTQHQIYATGGSSNNWHQGSHVLNLSASDYIELYVWHNKGSNASIFADGTHLTGYHLIGA